MSDDKKVIFSMVKVNKTTPTGKHILKDIYLSFFYGAKIGIIGNNGAGKSTVMKIIAGLDEAFQGDVVWADGYTVGTSRRNLSWTSPRRFAKSLRKAPRRLSTC